MANNMSQSQLRYEVLTWNQVYRQLLNLTRHICEVGFKPDIIVGISRGGLIPARVISDLLNNSNIANVKIERYATVGQTNDTTKLTQCLSANVRGKAVLVVDEIVDSGESLKVAREHAIENGALEIKTATIYLKQNCTFEPDFYEKITASWIVFPWEFNETVKAIYEKYRQNPKRINEELAKLHLAGVPKRLINYFAHEFHEAREC